MCLDITPNTDYKCGDFDNSRMMDYLIKQVRQKEEELLKTLIHKITGREATIEDFKKLTKLYYEGEPMNYDIAYDGQKIGHVHFQFGPTFYITFKPCL